MYEDLYELLVPGFLSASIELEGCRITLRSLTSQDLHFLRRYVGDDDPTWRYHLIAHSVWMVDGIPFLDSPYAHKVVYDELIRSSRPLVLGMLSTVYGFFSRAREANYYLESYLYEEDSRRLWRGLNNGTYPLHTKTAIPGVAGLGSNVVQTTWASWNVLEDIRDDQEAHWSNTKILVALQSHKSYETLNNRDKLRNDNEDSRRENVKERAWHRFQYGPPKEVGERFQGETVHRARTNDELEDEMRRWIRGDLDEHDQIVEAYKAQVRQEIADREAEKERVLNELRAKKAQQETDLGVPTPALRAVTPEQLEEILKAQRRPGSGAKFIVEADPASKAFNRYLRPEVKSGNLSVDSAGRIIEQPPVVPSEGGQSLTDQVASRRMVVPDEVQS